MLLLSTHQRAHGSEWLGIMSLVSATSSASMLSCVAWVYACLAAKYSHLFALTSASVFQVHSEINQLNALKRHFSTFS